MQPYVIVRTSTMNDTDTSQYTILVVDDDQDIVNAIETILSIAGYQVIHAYNGSDCLELTKTTKPNLILLDLMLPDMHGSQIAQRLRERDDMRNVPIVVISAAREASDIAKNMNAQACIEKPFELQDLLTTVSHHLNVS